MADIAAKVIEKVANRFFEEKHAPYFTICCYLLAGAIGVLCCISQIAPFSCSSDFIDSIVWKGDLKQTDFVVIFPIIAIALYIVCLGIRIHVLRTYEITKKNYKPFVHLIAVEDMLDLLAGVASLFFMISVFLQMYHTGSIFLSDVAVITYAWTAYKFLAFFYVRFANKNVEIINNTLTKHPDSD